MYVLGNGNMQYINEIIKHWFCTLLYWSNTCIEHTKNNDFLMGIEFKPHIYISRVKFILNKHMVKMLLKPLLK